MSIETAITIEVLADPDYHFAVSISDGETALRYIEGRGMVRAMEREIIFASDDEMIAVAEAMLKAAKTFRS